VPGPSIGVAQQWLAVFVRAADPASQPGSASRRSQDRIQPEDAECHQDQRWNRHHKGFPAATQHRIIQRNLPTFGAWKLLQELYGLSATNVTAVKAQSNPPGGRVPAAGCPQIKPAARRRPLRGTPIRIADHRLAVLIDEAEAPPLPVKSLGLALRSKHLIEAEKSDEQHSYKRNPKHHGIPARVEDDLVHGFDPSQFSRDLSKRIAL
jgi:hypothetical protein